MTPPPGRAKSARLLWTAHPGHALRKHYVRKRRWHVDAATTVPLPKHRVKGLPTPAYPARRATLAPEHPTGNSTFARASTGYPGVVVRNAALSNRFTPLPWPGLSAMVRRKPRPCRS